LINFKHLGNNELEILKIGFGFGFGFGYCLELEPRPPLDLIAGGETQKRAAKSTPVESNGMKISLINLATFRDFLSPSTRWQQ